MAPATDRPLREQWSPWHDRLHRHLLAKPSLLPQGSRLLLAVSGGQDSMALTGLLLGLQRRHQWTLELWHGDHGWHDGSAAIAAGLQHWCREQEVALHISCATAAVPRSEAGARTWRYSELDRIARQATHDPTSPCSHVVCGHTASDAAETLLLQLARGSDLTGLTGLTADRPLMTDGAEPLRLVRPLLVFDRDETAAICAALQLPIWVDPSNNDRRLARNRIREDVLPVLKALHPGCEQRMTALGERVSQVRDTQATLLELTLNSFETKGQLQRPPLAALAPDVRRSLLAHWLQRHAVPQVTARQLEALSAAIAPQMPPSGRDLPGGWRLQWTKTDLQLLKRP